MAERLDVHQFKGILVSALADSSAPIADFAQGIGLLGGTNDGDDATTSGASIAPYLRC